MHRNDAQRFDDEWDRMAGHLGFKSGMMNNKLGYGDFDGYGQQSYGQYGGKQSNGQQQRGGGYDDARRGHFLPVGARSENQPVNMKVRDIEPTNPQALKAPPGQNQ